MNQTLSKSSTTGSLESLGTLFGVTSDNRQSAIVGATSDNRQSGIGASVQCTYETSHSDCLGPPGNFPVEFDEPDSMCCPSGRQSVPSIPESSPSLRLSNLSELSNRASHADARRLRFSDMSNLPLPHALDDHHDHHAIDHHALDALEAENASQWLSHALSSERASFNEHLALRHKELLSQFVLRFEQFSTKDTAKTMTVAEDSGTVGSKTCEDSPKMQIGASKKALKKQMSHGTDSCTMPWTTAASGQSNFTVLTKINSTDSEDQGHEHPNMVARRRFKSANRKELQMAKAKSERYVDYEETYGIPCQWLAPIVNSLKFELAFALVIVANCMMMCVRAQYRGLTIANEEGFAGYSRPVSESWPSADTAFEVCEMAFGVLYLIEVVMKILALQLRFPLNAWCWLDTLIVSVWIYSMTQDQRAIDPNMFRLLRFSKLLRLARLVRAFHIFDVLRLLIGSLKASFAALFWSVLFLSAVMTAFALCLNTALEPRIQDDHQPDRVQLFSYFGTFSRSIMSVWIVTLGNPAPIVWLLVNSVSEWFILVFLIHHFVLGFATITVVRAIFLHETLRVSQTNSDIMVMEKERQIALNAAHMLQVFEQCDADGDGHISIDDFQELVRTPKMKAFMSALGLEISDAEAVFRLLDTEGSGDLNIITLMEGFTRIKGAAKSIDIVLALDMIRRVESRMKTLTRFMGIPDPREAGNSLLSMRESEKAGAARFNFAASEQSEWTTVGSASSSASSGA